MPIRPLRIIFFAWSILLCAAFAQIPTIQSTEPHAATYRQADPARPFKWTGEATQDLRLPNGKLPEKLAKEIKRYPDGRWEIAGYHAVYEERSDIGGNVDPKTGDEITIDIPGEVHIRNTGGKDGAGLCVGTSHQLCAEWLAVREFYDFQEWLKQYPGGSYPEKFDDYVRQKTNGKFKSYLNVTGKELCQELCRKALAAGIPVGTTYGYSHRYGEAVAHMVTLVHLHKGRAAIIDNNFPGEEQIEWMSEAEFFRRQEMMGGPWVLCLIADPPPPSKIRLPGEPSRRRDFTKLTNWK